MLQLLSILGLTFIAAAGTVHQAPAEPDERRPESEEAVTSSGYRVLIDPATGRVIDDPTPAEIEALTEDFPSRQRRPPARELRRFALSSGGEGVYLDGWADQALAVERDSDGSLEVVCRRDHEHEGPAESAVKDR